MAGQKFQPARLWCERSKCYCEIHDFIRLVTHCNYPRIWICDAARFILVLGHIVYDILFHFFIARPWCVHGANQIHLIVFKLHIVSVHVDDVVCVVDAEDWVR